MGSSQKKKQAQGRPDAPSSRRISVAASASEPAPNGPAVDDYGHRREHRLFTPKKVYNFAKLEPKGYSSHPESVKRRSIIGKKTGLEAAKFTIRETARSRRRHRKDALRKSERYKQMTEEQQQNAMNEIDAVIQREVAASDREAEIAWATKLAEEGETGSVYRGADRLQESVEGSAASTVTPKAPGKSFKAMRHKLLMDEHVRYKQLFWDLSRDPEYRSLNAKKKRVKAQEIEDQLKAERQVNIRALKQQFGIPFRPPRKAGSPDRSSDSRDWSDYHPGDDDELVIPPSNVTTVAESSIQKRPVTVNLPEKTRLHNRGRSSSKKRRFAPIDFEAVPKASQNTAEDQSSDDGTSQRRATRSRTGDNHVHASPGKASQQDGPHQERIRITSTLTEAGARRKAAHLKRKRAASSNSETSEGPSRQTRPAIGAEDSAISPRRSGRSHKTPKLFEDVYDMSKTAHAHATPEMPAQLPQVNPVQDTSDANNAGPATTAITSGTARPPTPKRRARGGASGRKAGGPIIGNRDPLRHAGNTKVTKIFQNLQDYDLPPGRRRITDIETIKRCYQTIDPDSPEAKQPWKLGTHLFKEWLPHLWGRRPGSD
ncbi:hypothetical protein TWF696_007328 [Orbilia brochopaga]|uniref:Uncharacterized protein n=1 Tax=Orbilia brochopaga TaxID=3140254 RepID=A0AAV9UYB0_9PEZI